MKSPFLVVNDLALNREGKTLLQGISFTLRSMEVLSVVGESGAGKGLFVKTLLGIHKGQLGGQIQKVGSQKVGLVSKAYPCIDHLSIFTNLSLVSRLAGVQMQAHLAEEVEDVLKSVGLWGSLKGQLHEPVLPLSHFEKNLLNLARTLLLKPTILILDQPTKDLDPVQKAIYESVIESLKGRCSIIWVNHDLEQVARVSDQVLFLQHGQMIECANCEDFFNRPLHAETENYISGRIHA